MAQIDPEKAYPLNEATALFGVNYMTLWRWVQRGKVKAGRTPGGQWRIMGSTIIGHLDGTGAAREVVV